MISKIRFYIPNSIKPILRFFRYRNERKKFVRELSIRKRQNELLQINYKTNTTKLIVFLVIGSDWSTGRDEISGGIISIVSICEETAALLELHGAATIMCTINNANLLLKHERFQNNTDVYRFSQLKNYFTSLSSIVIHVPEFLTETFSEKLSPTDLSWLKTIPEVHINVMNQNIRLMPEPFQFEKLKKLAGKVTITTAHTQYCTPYFREYFGVPIHKLSVWISPEQYQFKKWEEKENLMVVSPDPHPMKETILKVISNLPKLTVQIIQNLTYQEYKKLVSRAKWTLTFEEGLDGYFIEPVFSGAIAFAVYNEIFFTNDFKELDTVYDSMETLAKKIVPDMYKLDDPSKFRSYQQEQFELCSKYYNRAQYIKNIAAFYSGIFTYA